MKIVHEIYSKAHVAGGSISPDRASGGNLPKKAHLDELFIEADNDVIYISGSLKHVYKALQNALNCLEGSAQMYVEQGKLDPSWKSQDD